MSFDELTTTKVRIPIDLPLGDIPSPNDLVGEVVYVKEFFIEKSVSLVDSMEYEDGLDYFAVSVVDAIPPTEVVILDANNELPVNLYDIAQLKPLLSTDSASLEIKGTYLFSKQEYQRFFGKQYLSTDIVEPEIQTVSYSVLPFKILGAEVVGTELVLTSEPYRSVLNLFTETEAQVTLIFADYSFTKTTIDTYENGTYYHTVRPDEKLWRRVDTDVDPWQDEVFTSGNPLKPALVYSCSCPNHSKAILRAPQETEDGDTRLRNRQYRYPLPSVLGQSTYEALSLNQAAGKTESWETPKDKLRFKMCKHSIAAMFIERLKVKEPSSYPSVDSRIKFEAKLKEDIEEVGNKFASSYRRGGITSLELIFAMSQALNLNDTETAYVMLNSTF